MRFAAGHGLALLMGLAASTAAQAQVRLNNSLSPAVLTQHVITIRTTRQPAEPAVGQPQRFVQTGRWVRYNLDALYGDRARVAQLLVLEPASRSTTFPEDAPLPSSRIRLRTVTIHSTRDETVRLGSLFPQHLLLERVLDHGHFPGGKVQVGQRWQQPIERADLAGTLSYELTAVESAGEGRLAVIAMSYEGRLGDDLQWLEPLEATLYWSTRLGTLSQLTAQAAVRRTADDLPATTERIELKIKRLQRTRLDPRSDREVRQSLIEVSELVAIAQQGEPEVVARRAQAFLRSYPHSPWRPVVDHYLQRLATLADAQLQRENMELISGLAALVVRWQEASSKGNEASLARVGRELAHLAVHHAEALRALVGCSSANVRSMAVFALGFGPAENLELVVPLVGDGHPRVRAWAYCALARLADTHTDPQLLQQGLNDADHRVRARAAEAVAACWDTQAAATPAVRDRLIELLDDDSSPVRAHAARALVRLGDAQALPAIKWAIKRETDLVVRRHLAECEAALEGSASRPSTLPASP